MARLPLTVNVSKLIWAEHLKSRGQQTSRIPLARSSAAGVSRFQRAPWLSQHRHAACQPPSSARSRFPRASPTFPEAADVSGRGAVSAVTPTPSLFWLRVRRKAIEEGCWGTRCSPAQSHKPLPGCPLAASFSHHCPPAISCNLQRIFLLSWVNVKSLPLWWPADEPEAPLKHLFKGLSGIYGVKKMPAPVLFMDGQLQALGKGKIWLNQKSFSESSGSPFAVFSPLRTRISSITHLLSEKHCGSHVTSDCETWGRKDCPTPHFRFAPRVQRKVRYTLVRDSAPSVE